jgi:hypothetical protein
MASVYYGYVIALNFAERREPAKGKVEYLREEIWLCRGLVLAEPKSVEKPYS